MFLKCAKDDPAPVDLSQLRIITGGDPEAEKELLAPYKEQSAISLKILSENCIDGPSILWKDTAHAMKGGAASIGAKRLSQLCNKAQHIETATAEERFALLAEINDEYMRLENYLKVVVLLK